MVNYDNDRQLATRLVEPTIDVRCITISHYFALEMCRAIYQDSDRPLATGLVESPVTIRCIIVSPDFKSSVLQIGIQLAKDRSPATRLVGPPTTARYVIITLDFECQCIILTIIFTVEQENRHPGRTQSSEYDDEEQMYRRHP